MENQQRLSGNALRGGIGPIEKINLFGEQALPWGISLAGVLELPPGSTIGQHDHTGEWEFFYVLEGELWGLEAGQEVLLTAGDVTLTGGGQEHRLQNRSNCPAKVLALIAKE